MEIEALCLFQFHITFSRPPHNTSVPIVVPSLYDPLYKTHMDHLHNGVTKTSHGIICLHVSIIWQKEPTLSTSRYDAILLHIMYETRLPLNTWNFLWLCSQLTM